MKEITLEINGNEYKVKIENLGAEKADVIVNERAYEVNIKDLGIEKVSEVKFAPAAAPMAQQGAAPAAAQAPTSNMPASTGGGATITAPLPGLILNSLVKAGDSVKKGQNLMVMEAMKMENEIEAPSDGVIKEVHVKNGDNVAEGDLLITLG